MRTLLQLLLALAIGLLIGTVASAQVVPNPSTVVFEASADHARLGLDTFPLVTRYDLELYLEGATQPMQVVDLGKPTPDAQNTITITNRAWFVALAMNTRFFARVVAVGPSGVGRSGDSNPFGNVGPPAAPGIPVIR